MFIWAYGFVLWLVPLLWNHGESEQYGGERVVEQSCSPYGGQEGVRGREGEEGQCPTTTNDLTFSL
jgi:hypothetical protein